MSVIMIWPNIMNICISQLILCNFYFRTTLKKAPCVDVRVFLSVAWVGKPAVAVVKLALERLLTWNVEVLFKFQFKFIYLLIRKIKIGFFISNLQVPASTLLNALQLNPSFYCGNRKRGRTMSFQSISQRHSLGPMQYSRPKNTINCKTNFYQMRWNETPIASNAILNTIHSTKCYTHRH